MKVALLINKLKKYMKDETKVEQEVAETVPGAPKCTNCNDSGMFCIECSSKEVE